MKFITIVLFISIIETMLTLKKNTTNKCKIDGCVECPAKNPKICSKCVSNKVVKEINTLFNKSKTIQICANKNTSGLYIISVTVPLLIILGVYLYWELIDKKFEKLYSNLTNSLLEQQRLKDESLNVFGNNFNQ